MRTFVVSGTDGIGRAVALDLLRRGDTVIVVGRNTDRANSLLAESGGRGVHVRADLSLISESRRAVAEIGERFPVIDGLVLCAQHYRTTRLETVEGFENTFALYYLSRYLLSHGLAPMLERAPDPIVVNVCAPGHDGGEIRWDDLQFRDGYQGFAATLQGSRANDLLGAGFAESSGARRTRYVLFHPGGVATSFSGEYDEVVRKQISEFKTAAKPVEEAIVPILALLDRPPNALVTASAQGTELSLDHPAFDKERARRLHAETERLLNEVADR